MMLSSGLCNFGINFIEVKNRKEGIYSISNQQEWLSKALRWASFKDHFSFLNGNQYPALHDSFPLILAVDQAKIISGNEQSFPALDNFIKSNGDWLFGYFSYDLKNEVEDLQSNNPGTIDVDHIFFFLPKTLIFPGDTSVKILSFDDPGEIFQEILAMEDLPEHTHPDIKLIHHTSKKEYIESVIHIKEQIVNGEFYEMNYCIEFSAKDAALDPVKCYLALNEISPMPFSSLIKNNDLHLICASPERFLKKTEEKIISQPIKGTIRRSVDPTKDEILKKDLFANEKERAENMMIVDLVRNDLAKSAMPGSVNVEEMFGIYSFSGIHQMISTISAKANEGISPGQIIENAFPMGSMTGAPKIRVMQEIEALENRKRGLYSGSAGYFDPSGNFDLNVVIRSIIYNNHSKTLSYHVGSAITYDSDPEKEYMECLLKASAIEKVLNI